MLSGRVVTVDQASHFGAEDRNFKDSTLEVLTLTLDS